MAMRESNGAPSLPGSPSSAAEASGSSRFGSSVWVVALLWAACGGVQSLAFAASPMSWVVWVGWVPVAWLALHAARAPRRLRSIAAAWWSAFVFWICTIPWIAHTISVHGGLPMWLGAILLALLAAYMALYQAAFVAIAGRLSAVRPTVLDWAGRAAVLAGLWASLEWLRERLFSGFPWAALGEALVPTPGALDLAPWIGGRGLSMLAIFWSVICAHLLDSELRARRRDASPSDGAARHFAVRLWGATALATVLALMIASVAAERTGSRWSLDDRLQPTSDGGESPRTTKRSIRVVQPNVPILRDGAEFVRNYRRLLDLSRCPGPGMLVVWPESAAFPYLWERHESFRDDIRSIVSRGCDLLFNSAIEVSTDEGPGMTNAALLATWVPGEFGSREGRVEIQRYDKMHLVPYGEYVPLKDVLPFVRQLARSVGEFEPGEALVLPEWRGVDLGVSICFEIVFPYEVAQRARAGADVLAVITNDAWFGRSAAPAQHLVSARLRAAESRRPLVFAATTGVSAVVDARGRVHGSIPLEESGVLDLALRGRRDLVDIEGTSDVTLYSRAPWAVDLVAAFLVVVGFLGARLPARLEPRSLRSAETAKRSR